MMQSAGTFHVTSPVDSLCRYFSRDLTCGLPVALTLCSSGFGRRRLLLGFEALEHDGLRLEDACWRGMSAELGVCRIGAKGPFANQEAPNRLDSKQFLQQ